MKKKILSPFGLGDNEAFLDELDKLCQKYMYSHWFIVFGNPESNDTSSYHSHSNMMSDGLAEVLEYVSKDMREKLDEHR